VALTLLGLLLVLGIVFYALYQFWTDLGEKSHIWRSVRPDAASEAALTRWTRFDRIVIGTRWGPGIQRSISLLGVNLSPGRFVLLILGASAFLGFLLGYLLSWLLFPIGIIVGILAVRTLTRRAQARRHEEFIAQMPELARTLSNASSAGLSVRTAIAMAADELGDPASAELRIVSEELNLGVSLDDAMLEMEQRLPSRELAILISSLVISSRSGGAMVSALRDIADTLETRKEVRREIRTTYAQTVATAYAVLGMGGLSLFLLEGVNSGTVDAMLRSPIGTGALIIAGAIYTFCIWAVRRMTRIDI